MTYKEAEDFIKYGCVLVKHKYSGVFTIGVERVGYITACNLIRRMHLKVQPETSWDYLGIEVYK